MYVCTHVSHRSVKPLLHNAFGSLLSEESSAQASRKRPGFCVPLQASLQFLLVVFLLDKVASTPPPRVAKHRMYCIGTHRIVSYRMKAACCRNRALHTRVLTNGPHTSSVLESVFCGNLSNPHSISDVNDDRCLCFFFVKFCGNVKQNRRSLRPSAKAVSFTSALRTVKFVSTMI